MTLNHLNKVQNDELSLMLGEEFPEFVRTFIEYSEELIKSLKNNLSLKDKDAFIIDIHSLKGSSRNVGAEILANNCLQVENFAREGLFDQIDPGLIEICSEFERIKNTLLKLARI